MRDVVAGDIFQPLRRRLAAAVVSVLSEHEQLARIWLLLGRRIPGAALRSRVYRHVSWPLVATVDLTLDAQTPGGTMLVGTADTFGQVVSVSGVWEPHVTAVVGSVLSPGDVCVDVGAHAGYYTLLASKLVGRHGHVYALEPSPTTFRQLCENLERNHVSNVTALEVAAGEAAGTATLLEDHGNSLLSALRPPDSSGANAADGRVVAVGPLTALVPEEAAARLRLVKIDVEGYEVEVLRGLHPLLSGAERVALVLEFTPDSSGDDKIEEVERLRDEEGFRVFRLSNEYDGDAYFPSTLLDPVEIRSIPPERCDLLLVRSRP